MTTTTSTTSTTTDVRVDAELVRELEAILSGHRKGSPVRSGLAVRWARDRTGSLVSVWDRNRDR